jgi:hypothetical protein
MRLDLIARNFAEGFIDLFKMMLKLVSQYHDREERVRINGKWVDIDPREWRNQFDTSISVGLGTGNKDQQVQHLMLLGQKQAEGLKLGVANPQNIYEADKELTKLLGFKNGDKFFTDPSQAGQQPGGGDSQAMQQQLQQKEQELAKKEQALQAKEIDLFKQGLQLQTKDQIGNIQSKIESGAIDNEVKLKNDEAILTVKQLLGDNELRIKEFLGSHLQSLQATPATDSSPADNTNQVMDAVMAMQNETLGVIGNLVAEMSRPKQIIRGPDGRALGIQ